MELFRAPAGPEQRLHNKPLRRDPTETGKSEPGREKRPRKPTQIACTLSIATPEPIAAPDSLLHLANPPSIGNKTRDVDTQCSF